MEYKQIYAVVRYPKTGRGKQGFDCVVYSKQTSNLAIMQQYFEYQTAQHPDDIVVLVKRETAKTMKSIWGNYCTNIGRHLTREQKINTKIGHQRKKHEIEILEDWEDQSPNFFQQWGPLL